MAKPINPKPKKLRNHPRTPMTSQELLSLISTICLTLIAFTLIWVDYINGVKTANTIVATIVGSLATILTGQQLTRRNQANNENVEKQTVNLNGNTNSTESDTDDAHE